MQFSAGNVISRAFSVTAKNFLTFFIIALVVMGPILVINHVLGVGKVNVEYEDMVVEGVGTYRVAKTADVSWAKQIFGMILNTVGQSILAGALAFGVFQSLRGNKPAVGDCLSRGFARLMPIIGVSLVYGICVGFGMLLLVVPGVMIACAWYVCVPVTTVEKVGVGDSLNRSGTLTKGYRWSIFGMFLLVILLGLAVTMLLAGVFAALGAVVGAILSGVVLVFIALYSGTLSAVCYHDLRVVKEGVSTEDLVKVFG